ncbi:MAG: hypothetical protein ACR2LN_06720 [Candidatus Levyibacteriota bacterium]
MQKNEYIQKRTKEIVILFKKFAKGGWVNPDNASGNPLWTRIKASIRREEQIQTIMFWGASDKKTLTSADEQFLKILFALHEKAALLHGQGCQLTIMKADLHIAQNGHGTISQNHVQLNDAPRKYLEKITQLFEEKVAIYKKKKVPITIRIHALSDLYNEYGLPFLIEDIGKKDRVISSRYVDFLLANARKHNRSGIASEDAAILYVARRRREQFLLKKIAPKAILIASGVRTGARDVILPKGMPGIFLKVPAPWFIQN